MPSIAKAFITHGDESPAYWQIGNLWQVMATGVQTDNSFTLLDQIIHTGGGGGPMTHTHAQDEGLYVIRGGCLFNAGGHQGLSGSPGTFVAIPGNTEHSFSVEEHDTHVLKFYLPAGFEQLLIGISRPATERLPPPAELIQEMLPPKALSAKLALDYGQDNILGDPFRDPPNPDLMYTRPTPGATVFPFTANAKDLPAYWLKNGLWTILASGKQTGSSYSLIEQRLGQGPVYSPHMFSDKDIVYYILGGEMTFLLCADRNSK
jgi:quercetin dioxygenase-like cupin family protein